MKYLSAIFCSFILLFLSAQSVCAQKQDEIKLVGALPERATVEIPNQKLEIDQLPCTFYLNRDAYPITIKITSPNYDYRSIIVRKESRDLRMDRRLSGQSARTFVVSSERKQIAHTQQAEASDQATAAAKEKDVPTSDVNNAPAYKGKSPNENTFALIIANEDYQMVAPVEMAVNDGDIFKRYCTTTLGIPEENIHHYPNATYGNMLKAFSDIKEIANVFTGDINLIVYYAGHGIPDNATKDAFILPVDADGVNMQSCFSLKDLYNKVNDMKLNTAIFFLDACFSGAQRGGDMIVAARGIALTPKEEKPQGNTIVFSAASDSEAAYPYKTEGHGLFTYYLLKKMQESNGDVTLGELAEYIQTNVSRKSIVANKKKQTPSVTVADGLEETWRKIKLIQTK